MKIVMIRRMVMVMRTTMVVVLTIVCLSRMTKVLTEVDGPSWREKLPPLPTVPLAVRERAQAQASSPVAAASQQNGTRATSKPGGLSSPPPPPLPLHNACPVSPL